MENGTTKDTAKEAVAAAAPAGSTASTIESGTKQPAPTDGSGNDQAQTPPWYMNPLVPIVVVVWMLFFWSSRKQKKKEKQRREELDGIKKGDRVVTVGRLHGTVVAVTEDTMTLKPDDKTGTTMKFDRAALLKVVSRPGEKDSQDDEKKT